MDHARPDERPPLGQVDVAPPDSAVLGFDPPGTPGTTRVVLGRDLSPLDRLAPQERRNLLVRVLCELVAYDGPDELAERLAG